MVEREILSPKGIQGLWDGKGWHKIEYVPYLSTAKILALAADMSLRLQLNYIQRGETTTFDSVEEFLSKEKYRL